MRRAILAAMVLAVPLFGGFECTVTTDPPIVTTWEVGGSCDYFFDYDNSTCFDDSLLLQCGTNNIVFGVECASMAAGGYCGPDPTGYDWDTCLVSGWLPGDGCDWALDYASSTCAGDTLTYCSETNVVGAVSCYGQCQDWYGSTATGTCGVDSARGYNACVCDIPAGCDVSYVECLDALWISACDGTNYVSYNCDDECLNSGWTKGVCDPSSDYIPGDPLSGCLCS